MTYEVKNDENNTSPQQTPTQQQQSTTSEQTAAALGTDQIKEINDCLKAGYYFIGVNDFEKAKNMFQKALTIDPNCLTALSNLAGVMGKLGDYASALDMVNKVIKIAPGFVDPYYNKGNMLFYTEDYTGAIAAYDQALALDFLHVGAMRNKGIALEKLGKDQEAQVEFNNEVERTRMIESYGKPWLYSWHATGMNLRKKETV